MEKQPIPHHHVYHPHIPHLPQPNVNVPLHLSYTHIDPHTSVDSHNQYSSIDSHDTTVEQFQFENIYPMAPTAQPAPAAPVAQPPHMAPAAPMGHPCCEPTQVCPPVCDPAVFDPPQQFQTTSVGNVIRPIVHPSHTVHNMHTHIVNQHYFPHTESCCFSCSCEDVMCGCPCPPPCPPPCPGPMPGHGMHPGMHPGMTPYPAHF